MSNVIHVVLIIANALICVAHVAAGNAGLAVLTGMLAAVLVYQWVAY